MSSSDEVLKYFDRTADDFDTIYRPQQSVLRRLRDRARGTVTKRLEWVEDLVLENSFKSVLDVGCGSGRFGLALAQQGVRSHGIDFAPHMISLAQGLAEDQGANQLATFEAADFAAWAQNSPSRFDLAIAMGVFDYVDDARTLLAAMATLSDRRIAVSFPKVADPLVPIRWLKFKRARCPLYLYSKRQVLSLAASADLKNVSVIKFHRDYLLIADGQPR